jgi:hypothetical protein
MASFAIKGTGFTIMQNPIFGESEIVVFNGKVEFNNIKNNKDKKQWGRSGRRLRSKQLEMFLTSKNH